MNLFYKYSHLQRFEQQNEKDGRNVKDNKMRKEKWEMKNEKWRWEKEKEKKEKTSRQEYHSRKSLFYYFVFEKTRKQFLAASKLESCLKYFDQ